MLQLDLDGMKQNKSCSVMMHVGNNTLQDVMILLMEGNASMHSSENVDRLIWTLCTSCLQVPMHVSGATASIAGDLSDNLSDDEAEQFPRILSSQVCKNKYLGSVRPLPLLLRKTRKRKANFCDCTSKPVAR